MIPVCHATRQYLMFSLRELLCLLSVISSNKICHDKNVLEVITRKNILEMLRVDPKWKSLHCRIILKETRAQKKKQQINHCTLNFCQVFSVTFCWQLFRHQVWHSMVSFHEFWVFFKQVCNAKNIWRFLDHLKVA